MQRMTPLALIATAVLAPSAAAQIESLTTTQLEDLGIYRGVAQEISLPADPAAGFEVELYLDGAMRKVQLDPHNLRSTDFELLVQSDDGLEPSIAPPIATLRGTVDGFPMSYAALSAENGTLSGIVVLEPSREPIGVEPLSANSRVHAIYDGADRIPNDSTCLTVQVEQAQGALIKGSSPALAGTALESAQIAIDTDHEFFLATGSVAQAEGAIETTINGVAAIYEAQANITYEITTIVVRSSPSDPYSSNNSSTLLSQFRSHWNFNFGGTPRDVAHLFSGRNLTGSVIGVAFTNTLCFQSSAYGLSQRLGSQVSQTALTAHELGHNWSSPHCDGTSDCAIMCSGLGGCTGNTTQFGTVALNAITNKRDSVGCLSAPAPDFPPTVSGSTPSSIDALYDGILTIHGDNFTEATSVAIGDTVIPIGGLVTVVSDSTIQITGGLVASGLGAQDIVVTGPIGVGGGASVQVNPVPTPIIKNPALALPSLPFTWQFAGPANALYTLNFSLSSQTVPLGGFDVLSLSGVVFTGQLTAAGTGSKSVVAPVLGFITVFFQMAAFEPGSLNFVGATNVSQTLVL